MVGEQQLDEGPPRVDGTRRVRPDLQAGSRGKGAAWNEVALALDLDHAHPAGAARRQALDVTECRDVDAGAAGSREQRLAVLCVDRPAVDLELHHPSPWLLASSAPPLR
jgi:hypothetical protein